MLTLPSGFDEFNGRCAELFAADRPPDPQQLRAVAAEFGYEFLALGRWHPFRITPPTRARPNPRMQPTDRIGAEPHAGGALR